ncbi:MAG: hypothetical protein IPJ30_13895 [Acidobacteria bacterium]|nr:hypothetical protein [Acidobacteriota bacterium]
MSEHRDLVSQQEARDAVDAAYLSFGQVAKFDQAKIDRICEAMSSVALSESARLGQMAHDETGLAKGGRQTRKESVLPPRTSGTISRPSRPSALFPTPAASLRSLVREASLRR